MKIATVLSAALLVSSFCQGQTVTVPEGTSVRLRLSQNVSSADAHAGDAITLEVLDDVQVGTVGAIRHGAQAHGVITLAHEKRRMGRAGAVAISIDYVLAADGSRVPVSAERKSKGSNSAGVITTGIVVSAIVFAPVAPLFLLKKGKDTDIPAGTPVEVFTTGDYMVNMEMAPVLAVPVRVVVAPPSQEHVIEGYTLSAASDAGSVDGDQTSLGDAARRARAKKNAGVK